MCAGSCDDWRAVLVVISVDEDGIVVPFTEVVLDNEAGISAAASVWHDQEWVVVEYCMTPPEAVQLATDAQEPVADAVVSSIWSAAEFVGTEVPLTLATVTTLLPLVVTSPDSSDSEIVATPPETDWRWIPALPLPRLIALTGALIAWLTR